MIWMKQDCNFFAIFFVYPIDSYYQVFNNSIYKAKHT